KSKKIIIIAIILGVAINLIIVFFQYPRVKMCQTDLSGSTATNCVSDYGYGYPFYFKIYQTSHYEMFGGFDDVTNDLLMYPLLAIDLALWSIASFAVIKGITSGEKKDIK